MSCPPTLRTFSMSSSNATSDCRTVTLSMVRFVSPVSWSHHTPSFPGHAVHKLGGAMQSLDNEGKQLGITQPHHAATPFPEGHTTKKPDGCVAVSALCLFRNSFWLRRAEKRLLSVGRVSSQLRMMSGKAVPSVRLFV